MRHDSNGCRADDVSILLRGRREALHIGGTANDGMRPGLERRRQGGDQDRAQPAAGWIVRLLQSRSPYRAVRSDPAG